MIEPLKQDSNSTQQGPKRTKATGVKTGGFKSYFAFWGLRKVQLGVGLFELFIVFIAGISLLSHIFTGSADQSAVINLLEKVEGSKESELTFLNWGGQLGAIFSYYLTFKGFGILSYLLPYFILIDSLRRITRSTIFSLKDAFLSTFPFMLWLIVTIGFVFYTFNLPGEYSWLAGVVGYQTAETLFYYIGWGTPALLFVVLAVFLQNWLGFDIAEYFNPQSEGDSTEEVNTIKLKRKARTTQNSMLENIEELESNENDITFLTNVGKNNNSTVSENSEAFETIIGSTIEFDPSSRLQNKEPKTLQQDLEIEINRPEPTLDPIQPETEFTITPPVEEKLGSLNTQYDPTLDLPHYKYPNLDLLDDRPAGQAKVDDAEVMANKNTIVETLENYGITIKHIKATVGPTVTLYEIIPDAGIRISKIKNLEDDIALSLAALGIRIIAPIPGKGTIGIEVPNKSPELVQMKIAMGVEKFMNSSMDLPVVLGKTISNEVYIGDLTKMPHLLMAGATGQGKSVGINVILSSLLYKKHPSQLKLVLVDPKKVELSLFAKIEKHFLAKLPGDELEAIITEPRKVVHTLNSLCDEMDDRYRLLKDAGCKQIKEYNAKFVSRRLNPEDGHRFLPYIVLVIDELADLMMQSGKEVETPIARLAQLARAIGIHLVVATQRPSVNIITGIIKANFPARLSFRVTAKVDSRTILDTGGAEQLVGKGDMLFANGSDIIRLQCPYIDTPEVERLVEFISDQKGYSSAYNLPMPASMRQEIEDGELSFDTDDIDVLFADAARLVVSTQQGSTSLIQRKMKLGYNRAGRIMDQLESYGVVGPIDGPRGREVIIKDLETLESMLRSAGVS